MKKRCSDITNKVFGRLTVLKIFEVDLNGQAKWLCRCLCGNEVVVFVANLKRGNTKSCGCLQKEKASNRLKTHGKTKTRLFKIWYEMKRRCFDPKRKSYKNYGGRGITVCNSWLKFEPFEEWAIQNGYKNNLTIDRVNNDDIYKPSNCRWVTQDIQTRNTRRNILYKGECASEASKRLGGGKMLVSKRIRSGWTKKDAFTTKPRGRL